MIDCIRFHAFDNDDNDSELDEVDIDADMLMTMTMLTIMKTMMFITKDDDDADCK